MAYYSFCRVLNLNDITVVNQLMALYTNAALSENLSIQNMN